MPKVIFQEMSLENNIDLVKWAFQQENGLLSIHDYTINLFPELANIPDNFSDAKINKTIEKVVTKYYYNNLEKIQNDVLRYSTLWKPFNDTFFNKLSDYLNITWPKEHATIIADVGIIPVCPRYLDTFSFSVHDNIDDLKLIETGAHELCHFLWFEKWNKLYPDCKKEEFESPHIVWEYSEMVVDPILNSDSMSSVLDRKSRYAYDYFFEIYDGSDKMMNKLNEIYKQNINIEAKIVKGFEYVKSLTNKNDKLR